VPEERILAIVTLQPDKVQGGGAPVFVASGDAEREKVATYLSRILAAQVHDLENGTYILVNH
jgi:hypothetical protein